MKPTHDHGPGHLHDQAHSHPHDQGLGQSPRREAHDTARPSLLMASAWQRLLGAGALLALLWTAVAWALHD